MKMIAEWKPVQKELGVYADGMAGAKTLEAVSARVGIETPSWIEVQRVVGTTADGIPGLNTARAVAAYLEIKLPKMWPSQSEVRSNNSVFGKSGNNLTVIDLPYPMRLSWDLNTTVSRMTVNVACADAVKAIFKDTLDYYGHDQVKKLGLDIFGGCYNNREIRGGKSLSMHAYGCAIDIDPDNNQMKWGKEKARLAKSEYEAFWRIVESHGAVSLGRMKNYDWMHFQFARLG